MLPFPDGYNEGLASAVSGSGKKIVGQLTNGSVSRAATWLDTKPKLLKAPMGIGSDARCISLDGSVIGGSISRADADDVACVWLTGRQAVPVWHLLKQAKASIKGWYFERVNSVSKIGNKVILVGWGHRILPARKGRGTKERDAGFVASFKLLS